ncbi:hypothetical protein AB0E78_14310 [Streptomyces sp. NPDC032198]|uniref:hypothetical protein n=1 Tax=unclassified Streptomyces TaxID=2593676 RepID=UPI0033E8839B
MVIDPLPSAVMVLGLEQFVQWRFGVVGLLCLVLLRAGIRARNANWIALGAVGLLLSMTQAS